MLFVLQGQATISNDGATIMKQLDIVHPAAKTLVDIAKSQDAEVSQSIVSLSPLPDSSHSCPFLTFPSLSHATLTHPFLTHLLLTLLPHSPLLDPPSSCPHYSQLTPS